MPNGRSNNVRLNNVVYVKPRVDFRASQDSGLNIYSDSASNDSPKSSTTKSGTVYFVTDSKEAMNENYPIAVIGSGDFGRSLATKIFQSGYNVNICSRNPERCR